MKRITEKRLRTAALVMMLLSVPVFAMGGNKEGGASRKAQAKVLGEKSSKVQDQLQALGFHAQAKPTDIVDFAVSGLYRGTFNTKNDVRGKITILNFWAPWCPPCRQEMPKLEKFYQHFKGNKKLNLIATAVHAKSDDVISFIKENGYNFPVYIDANGQSVLPYVSQGIPETFILNKDGKIIGAFLGPYDFSRSDFIEFIERLLK